MSNLRYLLAALAFAVPVNAANAVPITSVTDWGVHNLSPPGESAFKAFPAGFNGAGAGEFEDIYRWTFPQDYNVTAAAVSLEGAGSNINGGLFEFYSLDSDDAVWTNDTLIGSFAWDATSVVQTFLNLVPGSYFYRLTGFVQGVNGGIYNISSDIQAIPIPAALPLFAVGLGLWGFFARRKAAESSS